MSDRKATSAWAARLQPPYEWGPDLPLSKVRAGDLFNIEGTRGRASRSGTIMKIKRVNFDYSTLYFNNPMSLTGEKRDLIDGFVVRGNTVHLIVNG
jgi:hypothetical protein